MQYLKIKALILEQIESGKHSSKHKLPAERKLAEALATSRITLREALLQLETEGRIYREGRRGWFISPKPLIYDPTQTLNFSSMARRQQRVPRTDLLSATRCLANKKATQWLNLQPFSEIYQIERVRYLDERPVVHVTHYVRSNLFANLLSFDLTTSLTDIYKTHFDTLYQTVRYRIATGTLQGDMANALKASAGSLAVVVERINYNQKGVLIDCDIEYWRHDAIVIESIACLL